MSILTTMNIARQGLSVNQSAINIVSNNISNMNTAGYSKENVNLATASATSYLGYGTYAGSGVTIESISRSTDVYLQSYYRQQNSNYKYYDESSTVSSSLQDMTNELSGTGIEAALTSFYSAAKTLISSPSSITARTAYVEQAGTVAQMFNQVSQSLTDLQTSLVGDGVNDTSLDNSSIASNVKEVNSILNQLATVNQDIIKTNAAGCVSNNLLDTRDQLINKLSDYMPINVTYNKSDTVNVSVGNVNLIQSGNIMGTFSLSTGGAAEPAVMNIVDSSGTITQPNINSQITSGSMGAILDMCGSAASSGLTINGVLSNLNTLASGFAKVVNDLQTGTNANGTALAIDKTTNKLMTSAQAMFVTSDASATITAANIKVNDSIVNDPYLVAAARCDTTSATYSADSIGNASNITSVYGTKTGSYAFLNNSNPEGFLSTVTGDIGVKVEAINSKLTNQNTILTSIKTQLASETGVDLNEEIVDLTKYQKAYQASARVFSICNDLLDTLVTLGK